MSTEAVNTIREVQHCGAPAWEVTWDGKKLPMLFGDVIEADHHLAQLQKRQAKAQAA
jgi:hypothetical protein